MHAEVHLDIQACPLIKLFSNHLITCSYLTSSFSSNGCPSSTRCATSTQTSGAAKGATLQLTIDQRRVLRSMAPLVYGIHASG
jgi:hypothetical protein